MTLDRRPRAVTLACVFAGVMGFFLLLNLLAVLGDWGSLELQETVESALESSGLAGQGVAVGTALEWLRIAMMVMLLLSIASVVFAVFTARGDRPSRLSLTVLCVVGAIAFATSGLVGMFPGMLLVVSAMFLWTPEARVWFDLKNDRTPSPLLVARAKARLEGAPRPTGAPSADKPRPAEHPVAPEGSVPPAAAPPPPAADRLPPAAMTAAIVMLASSLLVASVAGVLGLLYLMREVDPSGFAELAGDGRLLPETMFGLGADRRTVVLTVAVLGAIAVVSVAIAALSVALMLNLRAAYVPSLLGSYLAIIGSAAVFPLGLPITLCGMVAVVALRRPAVRLWARRRP